MAQEEKVKVLSSKSFPPSRFESFHVYTGDEYDKFIIWKDLHFVSRGKGNLSSLSPRRDTAWCPPTSDPTAAAAAERRASLRIRVKYLRKSRKESFETRCADDFRGGKESALLR
ncbi:hypothetical protein CEXT_387821 [Caerostris extrusa]|uniref:Uncharacterized protein n=1 Tax=Caerostris extrusa TaxID=172846 RepID=A0AAV4WA42_CAEEX|nr:hypothetical protein CEXT_387821 [Caerostris extrusa]